MVITSLTSDHDCQYQNGTTTGKSGHAPAKCTLVIIEKGFAAIEARTKSELTRKKSALLRCKKTHQKGLKDDLSRNYLHPAALSRRAYILPISPIPMIPIEAVSIVGVNILQEVVVGWDMMLFNK